MTEVEWDLGGWLSAALDDPNVCQEFKDDIVAWFEEVSGREAVERETAVRIRYQAFLEAARLIQSKALTKE